MTASVPISPTTTHKSGPGPLSRKYVSIMSMSQEWDKYEDGAPDHTAFSLDRTCCASCTQG